MNGLARINPINQWEFLQKSIKKTIKRMHDLFTRTRKFRLWRDLCVKDDVFKGLEK